jgi:hypothetical protein
VTGPRRLLLAACLGLLLLAVPAAAAGAADVHPACSPAPADCGGWYRTDVTIRWTLDTGLAPVGATCATQLYDRDAVAMSLCKASDASGRTVQREQPVWLDKTAPTVLSPAPARNADAGGWYRLPVGVAFSGADALSGVRTCTAASYAGLDSAAASVPGTCTDVAGNVSPAVAFPLRFDATPPVITRAIPGRKPDHRRWYNRPLTMRFRANDALSGLGECRPVLVSGPPASQTRPVRATCTDVAGNVATRDFVVPFDSMPPGAPSVRAHGRDSAVRLAIGASADTVRLRISRMPGLGGKKRSRLYTGRPRGLTDRRVANGRRYRYTVTAFDRAGNVRRAQVRAVPGARLLGPADGATLTAPPLLRWTPVRGARYYNVQLFRDGRKVLSRWPAAAKLQLRPSWRFAGRERRLQPGTYRWYVWPGLGRRAERRFGALVGRSRFVVPAPPPA